MNPVTVRPQDTGEAAGLAARTIEIAAEIESGPGFDENSFDGVAIAVHAAEDLRMERSAVGQGIEAGGRKNLAAEELFALLPLRQGAVRGVAPEGNRSEVRVGIGYVDVS